MDSYEGNLDASILEDLTETDAIEYLTLKYGADFAKKAMQVVGDVLDDNIFYN